jgi:glucose/arabinose dehydrogenase/cytochrome c5
MRPFFVMFALAPIALSPLLFLQINPEHEAPPEDKISTPYRVEVLAKNLHVPWAMTFLPDRRIIFTERTGAVRVMQNDVLLPEPALVIDVAQGNKMGMLGLVADPHFGSNHFIYVAYDYPLPAEDPAHPEFRMRVVRFREERNKLVAPKTIIENIPAWSNHTGGRMRFAVDGTLYLTTGDANTPPMAQRLDVLNGKILRLNSDGSIPADNPFVHQEGARPEIWSYGHRNPQGFDFQPGTGRILETEHGPLGGDEVNWIVPKHNYGWPVIDHRRTQEGMETAVLEFSPSIAPGSASFYRGKTFPELHDNFLVGCLRGEGILRVQFEDKQVSKVSWLFHHTFGRIREVTESPEGYLYISTSMQDPVEGIPRPGDEDDLMLRIVPASLPPSGHPLYAPSAATLEAQRQVHAAPAAGSVESVIAQHCAACHGPELKVGMPLDVVNNHWIYPMDDAGLASIIHNGIKEKGMPPATGLSDADVASLIKYLRAKKDQK